MEKQELIEILTDKTIQMSELIGFLQGTLSTSIDLLKIDPKENDMIDYLEGKLKESKTKFEEITK